MRKSLVLKFKNARELWEFKVFTKASSVEINLSDYTLICDCDEIEIDVAVSRFNAHLEPEIVNSVTSEAESTTDCNS